MKWRDRGGPPATERRRRHGDNHAITTGRTPRRPRPAGHPQVAAALRAAAGDLLSALDDRFGPAEAGTRRAVGPPLLERLAAALEGGDADGADDGDTDCGRLLREAGLLRSLLPHHLWANLGRDLSPDESARLHAALDAELCRRAEAAVDENQSRLRVETDATAKYLSFLSHDIRGHLNGAMLTIELLRRDLQGDVQYAESVEDLDAMRLSMMGLVGTMDRFLQAERLRNGRVEVSPSRIDLGEFLRDQCRQIERQSRTGEGQQAAGLPVELDVPQGLAVVSDREILGLIVQNLLGNCVKYGDGRTVELHVTRGDGGPAGTVHIEVVDHGRGMSRELVGRLFEPFTRGHDASVPGTGLGLFIAKQSADLLRAGLRVESVEGEGTRFLIDLP